MNTYHRSLLQIIYEAEDILRQIPGHRWHPIKYHLREFCVSSMFGHYVQQLPDYKDTDPASISFNRYMTAASPLANALNTILTLIHPHDDYDIYAICEGSDPVFCDVDTKSRCMMVFELIEQHYPREQHKETRAPRTIPSSSKSLSWLPYKD